MWMTGRLKLTSTGIHRSSFPTRNKRLLSTKIKLNYIILYVKQVHLIYDFKSSFNVGVLTSSD